MADSVKVAPDATGVEILTDTLTSGVGAGKDVQRMKLGYGADGAYMDLDERPATDASILAARVDEAPGGVTYVGTAAAGALPGAATWRIKRLTESGGDVTVEWADGDTDYDNIWNDRASLTYS